MPETRDPALLAGRGYPDYEAITPEQVETLIPQLLQRLSDQFSALETSLDAALAAGTPLGWDTVMPPLHRIGEQLRWSWGVVTHLNAVCNSPELRDAHASQQADVVRFSNRLGQSRSLHQALEALQQRPSEPLDHTQQRILASELLSMQQRGVGLRGDSQAAFNAASERLAELSTQFGNHVLDATQAWHLVVEDPSRIAGLPERARGSAAPRDSLPSPCEPGQQRGAR